ncbi:MAG: MHS family MFS transporter [Saprospiraceae bacterium]|nr:MHS family MFS transporter [Saprospiraceae bacterium]MCC6279582.1 MHS family MFS transporter [Saprospiraceae bacterium]
MSDISTQVMSNSGTEETSTKGLMKVIMASSVGTLIEWYDFYIYGAMATTIAKQFFPQDNPTAAFLAALATFAAGFVVRPFGALVFGRIGDLIGRKYTFLLTLLLMGGSTFAIGLIPGYAKIGIWAPILILLLRFVQGLALGGEYGGAATYVAEHSPVKRRGYYTAYIQTTATLGFFLSLGVILTTRKVMGVEAFNDWGWRLPFIVSIFLIAISVYIRLRMAESPLFAKIKKEGKISANPLKESFAHKTNLKMVLLALFAAVMGQGVVWYTGQFYAQTFIERTLSIEFEQVRYLLCIAILAVTPFFLVFGAWSDKIGRKTIMMGGMLLAILTYRPIYKAMYHLADPKAKTEIAENSSVSKAVAVAATGDSTITTTTVKAFTDGSSSKVVKKETILADKSKPAPKAETTKTFWLSSFGFWMMTLFVFIQILYVTMVYGPIAAFLVELFPTRIRYTSMSLPYHIGNGIFGGLTPFIATRLVDASKTTENPGGDPYVGLWYPILIASVCFVLGMLFLPSKNDENVMD